MKKEKFTQVANSFINRSVEFVNEKIVKFGGKALPKVVILSSFAVIFLVSALTVSKLVSDDKGYTEINGIKVHDVSLGSASNFDWE